MIFAKLESVSIDDRMDKLHLIDGVAQLIEKVASDAVVVVAGGATSLGGSRCVDHAAAASAEKAVAGELPLSVGEIGIGGTGERTPAFPDFGVIVNFALVSDEGGIEEVIRHPWEVVGEGCAAADGGIESLSIVV